MSLAALFMRRIIKNNLIFMIFKMKDAFRLTKI